MKVADVSHAENDDPEAVQSIIPDKPEDIPNIAALLRDFEQLAISRPGVLCHPGHHIDEAIALVEELQKAGVTYRSGDNVYFAVSRFSGYGRLGQVANAGRLIPRIESDPAKRDPRDFVLWFGRSKFRNQILRWDSPWGRGYPGWHTQCATLATHYLGTRIDLHMGNTQHAHPHHSNELAIVETLHGSPWVSCWVHIGFLVPRPPPGAEHDVAAPSRRPPTLGDAIAAGFDTMDVRYFLLNSHYRGNQHFGWDLLDEARRSRAQLTCAVRESMAAADSAEASLGETARAHRREFWDAVADDLNTREALSVLRRVAKTGAVSRSDKLDLIAEFDHFLGLGLANMKPLTLTMRHIDLLDRRKTARERQDWRLADHLRDELRSLGIEVRDSPIGQTWHPVAERTARDA